MDDFDARILNRAADLVACGWTQGHSAMSQRGAVAFDSPYAVCFCYTAAVARALLEAGWWCQETWSAAFTLLTRHVGANPRKWNDAVERTQEQVVYALRSLAMVSAP